MEMDRLTGTRACLAILTVCLTQAVPALARDGFDVVIANGRVMDPETGLDAIRHVGIRGETVAAISGEPLRGDVEIDATGQIRVKKRLVDVRAVRANIESELAVKPEASVVVIADRNSDSGLLVRVIDQARMAGAENVSLAAPSQ